MSEAMEDEAAGSPSEQRMPAELVDSKDTTVVKERSHDSSGAFHDLSHSDGVTSAAEEQAASCENTTPEIRFASETIEPTVGVISNLKVPNYSKSGSTKPIFMSSYEGPYAKLRFEEQFDQEQQHLSEQEKIESQNHSKSMKTEDWTQDDRRYFYKLGDSSIPRFWYEPGGCLPLDSLMGSEESMLVEIRIASEHLTLHNLSVKSRNIWGETFYTEDSDLVAAVMHSGYAFLGYTSPNTFVEMAVLIQVTKYHSETYFPSRRRYCYQSREWRQESGYLYTICCVAVVLAGGIVWQLQSLPLSDFHFIQMLRTQNTRDRVLELPQWPVCFRADSSKSHSAITSAQAFHNYYTFNLSNELCLYYSLSLFLDRDVDTQSRFSYRLKNEVVYLETSSERYELGLNEQMQSFYFSLVQNPEKLDYQTTLDLGVPLPASHVVCIEEKLQWKEILWGVSKVRIRDRVYYFQRVMFIPRSKVALQEEDNFMDISK
ncbi:hypothetical protein GAYE_SCF35G5030 [Galdieria yellowstonensis]|uniref:Uncharacterized protein n=1 Tax=Galdieria yellowstonensis TaxID=3028027 RepID=A0AAV9IIK4_9RHOD|nr:hypothetical protein GAYE_SCF35G5030 [Galdieria yellowstonensis]